MVDWNWKFSLNCSCFFFKMFIFFPRHMSTVQESVKYLVDDKLSSSARDFHDFQHWFGYWSLLFHFSYSLLPRSILPFSIRCRRADIDFLEEHFHFIQKIFILLYFKVDSQSHDLYSLLEATMNDHFVISLIGYISSWFVCIHFWQQLLFS